MASNKQPDNLGELEVLGRDAAAGAAQVGAIVGLKQNTADLITADTDGLSAAEDAYTMADTAERLAFGALRAVVVEARSFMSLGRDLLKPVLGPKASTAWADTGFTAESLSVPTSDQQLQAAVDKMRTYLANNPGRENTQAGFTVARALELVNALKLARSGSEGVSARVAARKQAKTNRDQAETALRRRLHGLVAELGQLLDPMSPYWIKFGFNRPGAEEAPEKVKELVLTSLGNGRVKAEWPGATRSDYYHLCRLLEDEEGGHEILANAAATTHLMEGLTVGQRLRLQVRGVNAGGEGKFSPVAEIVVS